MADWAGLNHYILIDIAEKLPSIESYDSFAGVCKSWNGAARKGHPKPLIFEGPWLMFAEKDDEPRKFSSVSSGLKRTHKIFLPEANNQRCMPCKDWLVMSAPDEIEASLLHPLSRVQIHLPKFNTLSEYDPTNASQFLSRAIITANPATNSDYFVIILYGCSRRIGFWKSGDTLWTTVGPNFFVDDVAYSDTKKKLYGVDRDGAIYSIDIHGPNPTESLRVSRAIPGNYCNDTYLVEHSEGNFLVIKKYIVRNYRTKAYRSKEFQIFLVNIDDDTKHKKVVDLGNKALFLGHNTSYLIECSEINKCKPNCIYFSADHGDLYHYRDSKGGIGGGKDMGIYHISDGSIQGLYRDEIGRSLLTPPTWIGPSF